MIQAATGFELSFPLNQLQLTCSSYWQATERDFLIASASIYQLIHCDVAWHANEICNRLKTTAAFASTSAAMLFFYIYSNRWRALRTSQAHKMYAHQSESI